MDANLKHIVHSDTDTHLETTPKRPCRSHSRGFARILRNQQTLISVVCLLPLLVPLCYLIYNSVAACNLPEQCARAVETESEYQELDKALDTKKQPWWCIIQTICAIGKNGMKLIQSYKPPRAFIDFPALRNNELVPRR